MATVNKRILWGAGALAAFGAAYYVFAPGAATPVVPKRNEAFMFIKPHGQVPAMKPFIEKELAAAGLTVASSGDLSGTQIDKDGLIDAHYAAIGQYATKTAPIDLPLPADAKTKFEAKFHKGWEAACNGGEVLNLAAAAKKLKLSEADIAKAFEAAKAEDKSMKLMPGCYVAFLPKHKVYVVNGFYGSMRAPYVDPKAKLTWFSVNWDESRLNWEDFRGKVLGATDPTAAEASSIRAKILKDPKSLGLGFTPNTGLNCVHGSASPLEALNERVIWVKAKIPADSFGSALIKAGFTEPQISKMLSNPVVGGKPLFDLVEDTNTTECLAKLKSLKTQLQ